MQPRTIKIFMPTGDPAGLRSIEKSNWSGSGLMFPRALFNEARSRRELGRTGVYILVGPPEESGFPKIYIGEGDPIRGRIEQHTKTKEFWTTCIAFTSKDENLNKAHVQYLESRLHALARDVKRCHLENGNVPQLPSMSESDAADAEGFLGEILVCLPLLGVTAFMRVDEATPASEIFSIRAKGFVAYGRDLSQGFVVVKGSNAIAVTSKPCHDYVIRLRIKLKAMGVLTYAGDHLQFTQDFVFSSPSAAASVVLGYSANGRDEWRLNDGRPLRSVQIGLV